MRSFWLLFFTLLYGTGQCQRSAGAEQYFYTHQTAGGAVVPSIWTESKSGWYTCLRYNYEDIKTITALSGKTWKWNKKNTYAFTPMAGVLYGNTRGFTMATKADIEIGHLSFSTEPQYVLAFTGKEDHFFYNWSELVFAVSKKISTGVALQHTLLYRRQATFEKGIVGGISIKNVDIPVYYFKHSDGHYFVLGVSWNWAGQ